MFLDQLFRLFAWLVEVFIVLVLLFVVVFGIGLWSLGHALAGFIIVGAVICFFVSATRNRQ